MVVIEPRETSVKGEGEGGRAQMGIFEFSKMKIF